MTGPNSTGGETVCFNCRGTRLRSRFDGIAGVKSGHYRIVQCDSCSMAFIQTGTPEHVDYSDYGDHISTQDEQYYAARVARISLSKRLLFYYLEKRFGLGARILDFGCGAGFFMRSCISYGFRHVYGVEPSLKLRSLAETRLHLDPIRLASSVDELDATLDVVAMLDVIEHLPVDAIDDIMSSLVQHMRPGAILLGTTPNLNSTNIRLSKQRDPVIAPPQHTIYFTTQSLHSYLQKFGLRRKLLFATGLSTNSFFRSQKFSPSWVERPYGWRRIPAMLVRILFGGAGVLLTPFGGGYGMYFVYEKPPMAPGGSTKRAEGPVSVRDRV